MRRLLATTVFVLAVTPLALAASTCPVDYAHPATAKSIRMSLVQSFLPCGYGFDSNAPNATTETGTVPSCFPAETWHEQAGSPSEGWTWGPKGRGTVELRSGRNQLVGPEYEQNVDPEAVDMLISVQLSDIRDTNGRAEGTGGAVVVLRITIVDRAADQLMTIIDFPFARPLPISDGKARIQTSLSAALDVLHLPALPRCASVEVLAVQIKDPNGTTFATTGVYLP